MRPRPVPWQRVRRGAGRLLMVVAALLSAGGAKAVAIVPGDDAEVIEQLPAAAGNDERRARRELAQRPDDPAAAAALARRFLERARAQGDPRFAGLALAVLQRWNDPATAPADVLLLQATLDQHLHAFDAAAAKLGQLLRRDASQSQAWLTLATVRRVQGRYAESDAACRGLAGSGATLHAAACLAENEGLRGNADSARRTLQRLAATPRLDAATRGWLLTTRAELEQRGADPATADAAWREALHTEPEGYAAIAGADFLIERGRDAEALALLRGQPRSDAVLLRRAIAGLRSGAAEATADAREMRERIALANLRPDAAASHGREQAMFALWVERDAARAVALARANLERQREPIDLLLLVRAAQAHDADAVLQEARQLAAAQGLVDRRLALPS